MLKYPVNVKEFLEMIYYPPHQQDCYILAQLGGCVSIIYTISHNILDSHRFFDSDSKSFMISFTLARRRYSNTFRTCTSFSISNRKV
jgi:hypothetical protein